jgi:hypothetical protein
MAKPQLRSNPQVNQLFEAIEKYKEFCVNYGYKFDESHVHDMKSYPYQQFTKFLSGKNFKDQWADDARRLNIMM